MQVPVEVSFQNCEPTEQLRSEVLRQAQRLEKFSDRITSCRVVVHGPQTRHQHGDTFKVDIRIAMPQHHDVIVNHAHGDVPENEHASVAISNAFAAAQRRIEDAVREMRGQVKTHIPSDSGRVARFLAGEDCGFIETADGRELYFHRNAVIDGAFDRLLVGSEVRFVEEEGEKGPQASSVHVVGKHHPT
jgi:cold shock CspA family protein